MEYAVIVKHENGIYRALIPTLPNLFAEGASYDEAIQRAQEAAEAYLAQATVTTIEVETPPMRPLNPRSPQTWISSAGKFKGDEAAMQQHIAQIYAERRRQCEKAESDPDLSD